MSHPQWPKGAALVVGASLAGIALGLQSPLTSTAQLTHAQTLGGNVVATRSACAGGPSYAAAVLAADPTFYWRIGERTPPAVTAVDDATTNNLDGTVRGSGLTFGTATPGLIQCEDTYGVRFPGGAASTQFIVQQGAVPNPDTFTISAWIRTNTTRGGWVLGMGSARWGTSANRDRVLYLQRNGRPSFAVGISPRNILAGTTPVNDNQPHLLVGTVAPSGMSLYVDGVRVAYDSTVTAGAYYTGNEPADQPPPAVAATPDGHGYWRVGYDSRTGLGPVVPSRNQLLGRIDEIAVWQTRALTASEVADLYARNHW
jgi:hypothetical protein